MALCAILAGMSHPDFSALFCSKTLMHVMYFSFILKDSELLPNEREAKERADKEIDRRKKEERKIAASSVDLEATEAESEAGFNDLVEMWIYAGSVEEVVDIGDVAQLKKLERDAFHLSFVKVSSKNVRFQMIMAVSFWWTLCLLLDLYYDCIVSSGIY